MITRSVFRSIDIPAHTVTPPPPYRYLGTTLTGAFRSPLRLQRRWRPSFRWRVIRDSSVNKTDDHCCIFQVTWSRAHCRRRRRCLSVRGVTCNGRLARKVMKSVPNGLPGHSGTPDLSQSWLQHRSSQIPVPESVSPQVLIIVTCCTTWRTTSGSFTNTSGVSKSMYESTNDTLRHP